MKLSEKTHQILAQRKAVLNQKVRYVTPFIFQVNFKKLHFYVIQNFKLSCYVTGTCAPEMGYN